MQDFHTQPGSSSISVLLCNPTRCEQPPKSLLLSASRSAETIYAYRLLLFTTTRPVRQHSRLPPQNEPLQASDEQAATNSPNSYLAGWGDCNEFTSLS